MLPVAEWTMKVYNFEKLQLLLADELFQRIFIAHEWVWNENPATTSNSQYINNNDTWRREQVLFYRFSSQEIKYVTLDLDSIIVVQLQAQLLIECRAGWIWAFDGNQKHL